VSKPAWLKLTNVSNGVVGLSGTPTAPGTNTVTLRVRDSRNATAERTFTVELPNRAPSVGIVAAAPATADQPFTVDVITADSDVELVTIVSVTTPAWLQFTSTGPGAGVLTGTPTNANAGDNVVTFRLNDGHGIIERTLVIPVTYVNHAPQLTGAPATVTTTYFDTLYSHTFQTSDADGDALAISATGLPTWLTLVDNGNGTTRLSGTPTSSLQSFYQITLRASDGTTTTEHSFVLLVPMDTFRLDDKGTLTVMGGVGRDSIQVWVPDSNQLRATVNGVTRSYPLSAITGLTVYGLDENDSINVNTRSIAAYVLGGGGNDTLVGGDQRDTFIGGGGHDRLHGAAGDDRLSGLAGNDYLEGGAGKDYLTGGDGHDYLVGNGGNDRLYGDAGNDVLIARDSTYDILHGGEGDDAATYDGNDLLHELFATPA
jgi:Ca2+-binding RTX toxin-like protein